MKHAATTNDARNDAPSRASASAAAERTADRVKEEAAQGKETVRLVADIGAE